MRKSRARSRQILLAIADAPVVLSPSHFAGVRGEVWTGNMMMDADLSTAQAREERLRLIGAGFAIRIAFAMIDSLRQEARM